MNAIGYQSEGPNSVLHQQIVCIFLWLLIFYWKIKTDKKI